MDTDDYLPRVLEDDYQPEIIVTSDPSKWTAVHEALENTTSKSGTGSLFTVAWVLGLTLGFVWVWRNGGTVFGQWKANVHRRTNRRLHGIPDDDDRPFNVAYAAAALSRKQRKGKRETVKPQTLTRESSKLDRSRESARLRQRPLHAEFAPSSSNQHLSPMTVQVRDIERRSSAQPAIQPPAFELHDWSAPSHNRGHYQADVQLPPRGVQSNPSTTDLTSRKESDSNEGDHSLPERRKHPDMNEDDDPEFRTSKRSRVDGEEYIDGDNDAPWVPGGLRRPSLQAPKRGAKRHANSADEGDWEMSQDKRARKGSLAVLDSDALDIDEVAMATEPSDNLHSTTRGTKREREELDSVAGDDVAENSNELRKSQPSRKRRDDGRGRPTEPASRGRKRDRSFEWPASSEESGERDTQSMRRKRGRRHTEPEPDEDTQMVVLDVSESDDMSDIVEDPACGGRRIGEIWEVNGQSFKVGLDGRRLRHALVKQHRTKFPMPKDSAHNDARTHVDVVIEKWLDDEEYKQAKERFELAWQDSSPTTTLVKAEGTLEDDLAGKRLLWKGPAPTPIKGRASVGPSLNGRNPFNLAPSNSGRRVTSAHVLFNSPGESPKLRTSTSFSKWEKQDMEANSLKRMRTRLEREKKEKEQQKEQEEKQKQEAEKAKFSLPSAPISTPLAPTTNKPTPETKSTSVPIAATPATQETKTTTPATPSPFVNPAPNTPAGSIPNFFAKPPTAPATAAAPRATTQQSNSSLFPTSAPQNPALFTGKMTTTTAPTATKSSFSFGPSTTMTAPATSAPSAANKETAPAKPKFTFGSPAFSMQSATAPSTSAAAASTPPATSGAAKPTFAFGAPSGQTTSTSTSGTSKAPAAFSFATPPANVTTSPEQGKAVTPANPFAAKPDTQPSSTSFTLAGNLSSPFTFNQSSSQSQQPATQNKPTFQFGTPSTPNDSQNSAGTTPSGAGASASGSLLNRLGPAPTLSQQPSQQNTTTLTQNAWSSPFGGGSMPSMPSTSTTASNIFGQSQSQSQPQQMSSTAAENKPSPIAPSQPAKNVFGQPSLMGTQSAFSFGKSTNTSDPSKTAATPSPFALASQPGAPSIFGQSNNQSGASQQAASSVFGKPSAQSGASSQSAASVFGQPSGQSSASVSQPATSVFGQPSGQSGTSASQQAPPSVFGQPSGQSGALASQPATSVFEQPSGQSGTSASQSVAPVFGQPSGQSGASASQQTGSSVFGKPSGQSDASAPQPKAPFSFNFGGGSSGSTSAFTPNANPFQPAQAPATGAQVNPATTNNIFAFEQPSSNASNTTSNTNALGFGKPAEGEKK